MRRVCETIVAVEKQQALHILSACVQSQLSSMQSACDLLYCSLACLAPANFYTFSQTERVAEERYRT
jgi:hypothetical protein